MNNDKLIDKYNHLTKRLILLNKHYEKIYEEHICNENNLELRCRIQKNDKKAYVYQCLICGYQKGGALSKNKIKNINSLPLFDNSLVDVYYKERRRLPKIINKISEKRTSLKHIIEDTKPLEIKNIDYQKTKEDIYLKLKETFVNDGSMHIFLGVLKSFVYKKIIKEHLEKDTQELFKNEQEVVHWFKNNFSDDFHIAQEINGIHISEQIKVRIDFLIYPKKHLIEKGFVKDYIGVEVKYLNPSSKELVSKANKAIWQTITYNDCNFFLDNGKTIKPKFCMLFSNLSFTNEEYLLEEFKHTNNKRIWFDYFLLANHANVGELNILGTRDKPKGWKFNFGNTGVYFSKNITHDDIYRLRNINFITKKRIGNFQ